MACKRCNHRGYIETYYHHGGSSTPMIAQCPQCKDAKAYSDKVREQAKLAVEVNTPGNYSYEDDIPFTLGADEGSDDCTSYSDLVAASLAIERGHDSYKGYRIARPTTGKKDGEPCKVLPFRKG